MITELHSQSAAYNLTTTPTILDYTSGATSKEYCQGLVLIGGGDPAKNLDGTGGNFELTVTIGGKTVQPSPQIIAFSTAVQCSVWTTPFVLPANTQVIFKIKSPNAADASVNITVGLYDLSAYGSLGDVVGALDSIDNTLEAIDTTLTSFELTIDNVVTALGSLETVITTMVGDPAIALGDIITAIEELPNVTAIRLEMETGEDAILPDILARVQNITVTGVALAKLADSRVITIGEEGNTLDYADSIDNQYHTMTVDEDGDLDFYYEFELASDAIVAGMAWRGRLDRTSPSAENVSIQAYHWGVTPHWDTIGTIASIKNSSPANDITKSIMLMLAHMGIGDDVGKVRIRFAASGIDESHILYTDQIFVTYAVVVNNAGIAAINERTSNLPDNPADEDTLIAVGLAIGSVATNVTDIIALASGIDETVDYIILTTDKVDSMLELPDGYYRFLESALEEAPTSAAEVDAQSVRDALALALTPSVVPASGSIDDMLDSLKDKLDQFRLAATVISSTVQEEDATIVFYRGDTVPIRFNVNRDIEDATIRFTVKIAKSDSQAEATITKTSDSETEILVTGESTGEFKVYLTAADTRLRCPAGKREVLYYDVEITNVDEEIETVMAGEFILLPDITT